MSAEADPWADFSEAFFEESAEHVAAVEAGVLRLDGGTLDADGMHGVFRAVHSIKGLAATLGYDEVAAFTHEFESVLECLRSGALVSTPELARLLLRSNDTLKALLDGSRAGRAASVPTDEGTAALRAVLEGEPRGAAVPVQPAANAAPSGTDARQYSIRFLPRPRLFATGQDPMLVVRELAELGDDVSVVCETTRLPTLDALDPEQCHLIWIVKVTTTAGRGAIDQAFAFIEHECEYSVRDVTDDPSRAGVAALAPTLLQLAAAAVGDPLPLVAEPRSIRVPTDKVDALVDLAGELVTSQARVSQIATTCDLGRSPELQEALASLARGTRELQERVLSVRMLPVATVFNRFPRWVREVAGRIGKKVRLELQGAETELDKAMMERISDPLIHLVRNAIDHGLETPEDRLAAGKTHTGTVMLRAFHQGDTVVIEVSDDGRGLNMARIRDKAISNGLMRADEVLSDEELRAFIFVPGFSTAAHVSDLSGRGVGLDVVRRNVEGLNGSVAVASTPGQGSCFRLRLPLTRGSLMRSGRDSRLSPEELSPQRAIEAPVGRTSRVMTRRGAESTGSGRGQPVTPAEAGLDGFFDF